MGIMDGVNAVITGVERVREVSQKIHDAELQNAIADLMLTLAEAKSQMADLLLQNTELQKELGSLRMQISLRERVEFRNGLYYLKEEVAGYSRGPFCTRCLDCDGTLVTLRGPDLRGDSGLVLIHTPTGAWGCPQCGHQKKR